MSTQVYVDLMFAWGYARLGDKDQVRRLNDGVSSREHLTPSPSDNDQPVIKVREWLIRAFRYRIEQATNGLPHDGLLPASLFESFKRLSRSSGLKDRWFLYVVDRVRNLSRILEPTESVDPYRHSYVGSGFAPHPVRRGLIEEYPNLPRAKTHLDKMLSDVNSSLAQTEKSQAITHYTDVLAGHAWDVKHGLVVDLIDRLPRFRNTWTTAAHYSRSHLEIVDRLVLAIVCDGLISTDSPVRSPPADELPGRREALSQAHAKLMAWGRPDWGPTPNST